MCSHKGSQCLGIDQDTARPYSRLAIQYQAPRQWIFREPRIGARVRPLLFLARRDPLCPGERSARCGRCLWQGRCIDPPRCRLQGWTVALVGKNLSDELTANSGDSTAASGRPGDIGSTSNFRIAEPGRRAACNCGISSRARLDENLGGGRRVQAAILDGRVRGGPAAPL